jgi:hypothetical protein
MMDDMKARLICMFAVLFGLATLGGLAAEKPPISVQHLKNLLRNQGFSGALKGDIAFTYLGDFACGTEEYRLFYFVWVQTRPRGVNPHGQQRIVLIGSGERYAGSYVISDRPVKINHDVLIFPYDAKDGNEIRCEQGGIPKEAWLDGEIDPLQK